MTGRPARGDTYELRYDILVVTAGAVTRSFPIPGPAQQTIGLKHVEEAVAIRDRLMTAFDQAASPPPGPERRKLLTLAFVGAGFPGVEGFRELLSLATAMLRSCPELTIDDLSFHLVEARGRILPEVSDKPGAWVVRHLERRGAPARLNTRLLSAEDGHVVLSDGGEYDATPIVRAAGNAPNPVVHHHTDLPLDERGLLLVRPEMRVGTESEPVPDVRAAGDDATIPDLASPLPGARTVPNAQHAVRQGRLLATNLVADLRGRRVRNHRHGSLGVVATLGLGRGIFQYKGIVRVLAVWLTAALTGRDLVSLVQHPRDALVTSERTQNPGAARAKEGSTA